MKDDKNLRPRLVTEATTSIVDPVASVARSAALADPLFLDQSAWLPHVPFAFWLMEVIQPKIFVELGTHRGTSYFAFCQAVAQLQLDTACYAIDTWEGDEHSGQYGTEVLDGARAWNARHFASFSTLIKSTFADALPSFSEGSVDLLHIDGLHTYEAVHQDFTSWLPKLSDRGVVLFHDTNVRDRGFGVFRLLEELRESYPVFEFLHGHGLAVVACGPTQPDLLRHLTDQSDGARSMRREFRNLFARLGAATLHMYNAREQSRLLQKERRRASELAERIEKINAEAAALREDVAALHEQAAANVTERHHMELAIRQASHRLSKSTGPFTKLLRRMRFYVRPGSKRLRRDAQVLRKSRAFDSKWYRRTYPDVILLGIDPLEHYLKLGAIQGRNPSPNFDTTFYLQNNPDVAQSGRNPLVHYVLHGRKLGLLPKPQSVHAPLGSQRPAPVQNLPTIPSTEHNANLSIVFISGEGIGKPGYNYRIAHYAEGFERSGVPSIRLHKDQIDANFHLLEHAKLIYIWRASYDRTIEKVLDYAHNRGVCTWFDLDDLMVRPEFASEEYIDAIRFDRRIPSQVAKHYKLVQRTMRRCRMGSATTQELAWQMQRAKGAFPCFVLPNGFNEESYTLSRVHARLRNHSDDSILRIGYASGSRTHQADFRTCADAVATILRENQRARLVLFRKGDLTTLDPDEFPQFLELGDKIEWRSFVEHKDLPKEIARFDINLAPLEVGNPFCEAKSELKFFDAALADVPTIASPTGPFRRATQHGITGLLAETSDDWLDALRQLLASPDLRLRLGRAAHRSALWTFGPTRRARLAKLVLDQLDDARRTAPAFQHYLHDQKVMCKPITLADYDVVFDQFRNTASKVTVAIPLYNYADFVEEALESVRAQTMQDIDLIVVDDASTDASQAKALEWLQRHGNRFNRAALLQHCTNQGLGSSRNTAFDFADTLYVMALDADNLLRPRCCEALYEAARGQAAAFSYPKIQTFGTKERILADEAFHPAQMIAGNSVDAMALISKEAWSLVGGYATHRLGWQDYDLWCRFIGAGLHGVHVAQVLAEYRVHERSMLYISTDSATNKARLLDIMERDHEWLGLTSPPRSGYRTNDVFA